MNIIKILLVITFINICACAEWNYHAEPAGSDWGSTYSACNGNLQSPINIVKNDITGAETDIEFTMVSNNDMNGVLSNNGHSVVYTVSSENVQVTQFKGKTYNLAQLHFHWGADSTNGSEHTVDGNAFAAEMHMVHYDASFADLNAAIAADNGDSLLVVGQLFNEGANTEFDALTTAAANILYKGNETTVSLKPESLLSYPIEEGDKFWSFSGSLTTPTCNEIVSWVVLKDYGMAPTSFLQALRATYTHETDVENNLHNFRTAQAVNNRPIVNAVASMGQEGSSGEPEGETTDAASYVSVLTVVFTVIASLFF